MTRVAKSWNISSKLETFQDFGKVSRNVPDMFHPVATLPMTMSKFLLFYHYVYIVILIIIIMMIIMFYLYSTIAELKDALQCTVCSTKKNNTHFTFYIHFMS